MENYPLYSVYSNDREPHIGVHMHTCQEVRKNGGGPGAYDQVHWTDFDRKDDAKHWTRTEDAKLRGRKNYKGILPHNCLSPEDQNFLGALEAPTSSLLSAH